MRRCSQGRHSGHLCSVGGAAGENLEPYSVAIRPEGPILVDFSARSADFLDFSTHIQWHPRDAAQLNIHIQWSVPPVHYKQLTGGIFQDIASFAIFFDPREAHF